MDYENFFETFEKRNQFSLDNSYISMSNELQASSSPTRCRSRSSSITSKNIDAGLDINSRKKSSNPVFIKNENRKGFIEDERYRCEYYERTKLAKKHSRECEELDPNKTNEEHVENDCIKLHSHPIISPPPGFEDDELLRENSNQYNFFDNKTRNYSSALRTPYSPHREDNSTRSSLYRKNVATFHRKLDVYNCSYNNRSGIYNKDTIESRLLTNCNPVYRRNIYSPKEYLPTEQNLMQNTSLKLSPVYYDYDDSVNDSRWNRNSTLQDQSSQHHSYICSCDYCYVPLTFFPTHNKIPSSKNSYLNSENGTPVTILRNSPSREKVRRSASFQGGYSSPLYANLNNYSNITTQFRNADYKRRHIYHTVNSE